MTSEHLFSHDDVLLAPLSGYTDLPFRRACRRQGCYYAFTPLVDAGCLTHRHADSVTALVRGADEPWLGIQLLGASPEVLAEAARLVSDRGFDVVDLNMGCPVPKVTRRGAGAALGANLDLAAKCITALVRNSHAPVTAKIRVLSAADPAPTVALALALEQNGISALTIHGREWARMYSGPVAAQVIGAVREALRVPVVANGGVLDRASAADLRQRSGCRHLMVARGAIGNPWIFRELKEASASPPSHEMICVELELQVQEMVAYYGETEAMRLARKIILAYLVGRGYRRSRRQAVTSISTLGEFRELLRGLRDEGPSPRYRTTWVEPLPDG